MEFEGENIQDPFRFDIGVEENVQEEEFDGSNGGVRLQGLVWNTARPQAVINGEVVQVGDEVEGAVVEEISRDGVVIRRGKETLALSFQKVPRNAPEEVFE